MNNEKQFQYCTIRQDLIKAGLNVPIGRNGHLKPIETTIRYKWKGDDFYIMYKGWKKAQSIDFDFNIGKGGANKTDFRS